MAPAWTSRVAEHRLNEYVLRVALLFFLWCRALWLDVVSHSVRISGCDLKRCTLGYDPSPDSHAFARIPHAFCSHISVSCIQQASNIAQISAAADSVIRYR